ncbi:MAG: HDOD domain-containing protein [Opitutaceae bacterium]
MTPSKPLTLEQVCSQAQRLPCSPSLLPRLIAVLQDTNSGVGEIEDVIQLDPALTASTVRLANSAFFAKSEPVQSVGEAVMRLGQKEIFKLASLALANRWESGAGKGAYQGDPGDFSRHALCVGLAAEALAERTGEVNSEAAYTAGLVCDMGKLAIAQICGAFFPEIRVQRAKQGGSWLEAERAVLGYDHAQVGARLLRTWNFPAMFISAAEYYHRPAQAPAGSRPLLGHLHAAKFLAVSYGAGVTEEGFLFELDEAFLAACGFTPEQLLELLPVMHERALARLGDKLHFGPVTS